MRRAASVTSPTGFVKFTNVASGARRATTSAIEVTIGTVRRANVMPPAPVVSCPIDALGEGRGLVEDAAGHAAGADRAVDDVRPVDRRLEASRHRHRHGHAELLGDAVEDAADPVEPGLVDVVEGDLVVAGRDLAGREGPIDHRRPEPSGTDQGQLHACD